MGGIRRRSEVHHHLSHETIPLRPLGMVEEDSEDSIGRGGDVRGRDDGESAAWPVGGRRDRSGCETAWSLARDRRITAGDRSVYRSHGSRFCSQQNEVCRMTKSRSDKGGKELPAEGSQGTRGDGGPSSMMMRSTEYTLRSTIPPLMCICHVHVVRIRLLIASSSTVRKHFNRMQTGESSSPRWPSCSMCSAKAPIFPCYRRQ